eukprot:CAMPEP_0171298824 /NCGR_PEP_ID=MMETSP0816-20121228/7619_1 /TAXON_ID=420281 /ORGANISM="Proboscia inermis, Strain CCAP1064/1" /LENGTH=142 /DNA_ID=CAMNT_0011774157 /DNA_START=222 /DNA_END=650 /DNA_ORIENTATION=+
MYAHANLVDLPGYGYAKAPDKKVSKWQANTQSFLQSRKEFGTLKKIFLLVDAREGMTQFDRVIMDWLDELDTPYSIVITKSDTTSAGKLLIFVNEICMRYHSQLYGDGGCQGPVVHVTSTKTAAGINDLRWAMDGDFLEHEI